MTVLLCGSAATGYALPADNTSAGTPRTATHSAGPATAKKKKSAAATRRAHAQMAPTADRISEIQAALANAGAYHDQPNGKWDDATVDAMRAFQQSHGLNATGKLDALSLQKLGLGSDVAGRGAPIPQPCKRQCRRRHLK